MFERYTEQARRVIFFALDEARQFGSPYIETEHLLLGLLREEKARANYFLRSRAAAEPIRRQIEQHTAPREKVSTSVDLPLSYESKRVLAYGAEEAERLNQKHIGTEHLLLGLLREEKCFAAKILHERGLCIAGVREELQRIVPESVNRPDPEAGSGLSISLGASMFERYTEQARRAIFFARYEASQFGSPYIETEHLLLGLLREDKALANRFLHSHAAVESIRKQIEGHTAPREKVSVDLPLSHECKRVLAYGAEEAERLNHKHIGTEHLLLGLLREGKCFAAEILNECGLRLANIRQELRRIVPDSVTRPHPEAGSGYL